MRVARVDYVWVLNRELKSYPEMYSALSYLRSKKDGAVWKREFDAADRLVSIEKIKSVGPT